MTSSAPKLSDAPKSEGSESAIKKAAVYVAAAFAIGGCAPLPQQQQQQPYGQPVPQQPSAVEQGFNAVTGALGRAAGTVALTARTGGANFGLNFRGVFSGNQPQQYYAAPQPTSRMPQAQAPAVALDRNGLARSGPFLVPATDSNACGNLSYNVQHVRELGGTIQKGVSSSGVVVPLVVPDARGQIAREQAQQIVDSNFYGCRQSKAYEAEVKTCLQGLPAGVALTGPLLNQFTTCSRNVVTPALASVDPIVFPGVPNTFAPRGVPSGPVTAPR